MSNLPVDILLYALIAAGLKPGKALGAELERLERAWIESGFALDRKALLGMVRLG